MAKYQENIVLNSNTNIHDLVTHFNRLAGIHADILGFGKELLKENNQAWIISSTIVRINKPIKDDIYNIETWPKKNHHIYKDREFKIVDKNGNDIVNAMERWIIVDINTHSILRNVCMLNDIDTVLEDNFSEFVRIKEDMNDSKYLFTYKVSEDDIDDLGHFNNNRYIIMIENHLNKEITELQIDYINEGFIDEEIKVYQKEIDGYTVLQGRLEDRISFNARIK